MQKNALNSSTSFAWSHDPSPEGGSNPPPPAGAVLRGRGPGMLLQWSLPGRLANSSWRSSADCWVQKVARRARLAKGFYYPTPEDRRTKQRPGNSWEWTWRTQYYLKGAHLIRIRLQRFSLHGQKHKQGINATKVSWSTWNPQIAMRHASLHSQQLVLGTGCLLYMAVQDIHNHKQTSLSFQHVFFNWPLFTARDFKSSSGSNVTHFCNHFTTAGAPRKGHLGVPPWDHRLCAPGVLTMASIPPFCASSQQSP